MPIMRDNTRIYC